MKNNKTAIFLTSLFLVVSNVEASSLYGSPVSIAEPGKLSVKLEGSIVRDKEISVDSDSLYATIGTVPLSINFAEDDFDVDEETAGVGLSYVLAQSVELFGSIIQGVQSMSGSGNSDSHSAYRAGLKFVPSQAGPLKFGFVVQMSQSKTKYQGEYQSFLLNFQSPTTNYFISEPFQAKEELDITVFNALFGIGFVTKNVDPYFGLSFSQVSGSYEFTANDAMIVGSYPASGGPVTTTTENVSLSYKPDIKTTKYFEAIVGVRFKTDINMFFDLEAHMLLEKGVTFDVGYTF